MTPAVSTAPAFDGRGMDTPAQDVQALRDLVLLARREGEPHTLALEVGTWAGRTAIAMADAGALVHCVDTWQGADDPEDDTAARVAGQGGPCALFAAFRRNAGDRWGKSVLPLVGTSAYWADLWPAHRPLDLVFLDGDHREAAVRADIAAWTPHVRPGGVLCGHDYPNFPGVVRAVEDLVPGFRRAGSYVWWARVGVSDGQ